MRSSSLLLLPVMLGVDTVVSAPLSDQHDRRPHTSEFKQIGEEIDREQRRLNNNPRHYGHAIVKIIPEGEEVSFKVSNKDSNMRLALASDQEDLEYSLSPPEDASNIIFESLDDLDNKKDYPQAKNHETIGTTESVATQGIKLQRHSDETDAPPGGLLQVKASDTSSGKRKGGKKDQQVRTREERNTKHSKSSWTEPSGGTVAILNHGSNIEACFEAVELAHYVGETATFKVGLCDSDTDTVFPNAVTSATFSYITEDGTDIESGDVESLGTDDSSEWIEVSFIPNSSGPYKLTFDIDAVTEDGDEIERQVTASVAVVSKQIDSVHAISLEIIGEEIEVAVVLDIAEGYTPAVSDIFILAADILDGNGADVMTASAMSTLVDGNKLVVKIQPEWFAGRSGDYTVEYLTVKDAGGAIPLLVAEGVRVDSISLPDVFPEARRRLSESDTDRRRRLTQGILPDENKSRRSLQSATSNIIATHGYCAGDNPWKIESAFAEANFFEDLNQSRTHDEFAIRLRDFGNSLGYSTAAGNGCSIIGHSQGGAAALHLYTYYWSCLDGASSSNGNSNRLIQSVGTPFQGTSLAGSIAALGDVFGAGCGDNEDMTYDGAANWLSGIPNWARDKVYYYTTSFEEKWWRYDYCNIASDLILSDPDDGTTEKAKGQLPGGNNRGHTTGWCHIDGSGMRDPAQTSDHTRNVEMVANAAS